MQVDFPITRHHVPTSTKISTGGKGFRTLHLLGDHGMHLAERGGLLHLLEAVLHLIEILQLCTRAWFSTLTLRTNQKTRKRKGIRVCTKSTRSRQRRGLRRVEMTVGRGGRGCRAWILDREAGSRWRCRMQNPR